MKGNPTYTITSKDEFEINKILDIGLNEVNDPITNPNFHNTNKTSSSRSFVSPYHTSLLSKQAQLYSVEPVISNSPQNNSISTSTNPQHNPFTYEHRSSINNETTYSQMKSDLKKIQSNINNLEQKLFKSNSSLMNNSLSPNNPMSPSLKPVSIHSTNNDYLHEKPEISSNFDNGRYEERNFSREFSENLVDLKTKLLEKENMNMKLQAQVENCEREKLMMRCQMEEMNKDLSEMKMNFQKQMCEIKLLQEYKTDCDNLRNEYRTLMREFRNSEDIRNEQKNLLRNMQRDIDMLRQESYMRISQIEMRDRIKQEKLNEEKGGYDIDKKARTQMSNQKGKKKRTKSHKHAINDKEKK